MADQDHLRERYHELIDRVSDPRLTIAGRELRVLGREKTIILAIVIQLFVAAFSGFSGRWACFLV
jgi:hypothetical protein